MAEIVSQLGQDLAATLKSSGTPAFNLRFVQIQNTVIKRLNEKLQGIADSDNTLRRREALQAEGRTLSDSLDEIEEYIFINETNSDSLQTALATATSLLGVISREDADTNVTSGEAFDFESVRNKLSAEIDKLQFVVHPDLLRPDLIQEITALGQELGSKNLVVGTVDAEGTVNTTNNNRPIQDFVQRLHDKIDSALIVTNNSVFNAKNIRFSLFGDIASNQTDRIALSQSETKRKEIEIEQEKQRAGLLLQAISLSFEVRQAQTEKLNSSLLEGQKIPPGSILNLFS